MRSAATYSRGSRVASSCLVVNVKTGIIDVATSDSFDGVSYENTSKENKKIEKLTQEES